MFNLLRRKVSINLFTLQGTKFFQSLTMKTELKALGKIYVSQMKSYMRDQLHFMSC